MKYFFKALNKLCKYDSLVKHLIADQMIYLEQSKTRSMSHTAIGYARYYNELIPPMYFLDVIHFHHFRPWLFFIQ